MDPFFLRLETFDMKYNTWKAFLKRENRRENSKASHHNWELQTIFLKTQ